MIQQIVLVIVIVIVIVKTRHKFLQCKEIDREREKVRERKQTAPPLLRSSEESSTGGRQRSA
jgi:hypothetical protein